MEALSLISQLYMWILVILLFIGIGLGILEFINNVSEKLEPKKTIPVNKPIKKSFDQKNTNVNASAPIDGFRFDMNWLQLALFSFAALLLIVTMIGFFTIGNPGQDNQHLNHQNNFGNQINYDSFNQYTNAGTMTNFSIGSHMMKHGLNTGNYQNDWWYNNPDYNSSNLIYDPFYGLVQPNSQFLHRYDLQHYPGRHGVAVLPW